MQEHATTQERSPPRARSLPRTVFWSIITAVVASMALTHVGVSRTGPTLSAVPFFSSLFLVCCILGGWLGLGQGVIRLVVPCVAPILLGALANYSAGGGTSNGRFFYPMVCAVVAFVAATTFTLRLAKGTLRRVRPEERTIDALRFGIKDVMILTAVVALLVSISKLVLGFEIAEIASAASTISLLSGGLAVATVINFWAMHGRTITPAKISAIIVFTLLAAIVNWMAMLNQRWFFPLVIVLCESMAVGLMYCLRLDGYRFVKR